MKPSLLLIPVVALGLAGPVGRAFPDFSRYEIILQKEIFGKPPPEPVPVVAPPAAPGPSWVNEYRMAMLVDEGGGHARAALINIRDNTSVALSLGEPADKNTGLALISVDINGETAVFEKSGDRQTMNMKSGSVLPIPGTGTPAGAPPPTMGRMTGGPGHRFGSGRSFAPPPPPTQPVQPKLTGAELEAHLQEYQKEVLRKGMPPLPVALTPENDAIMVQEGVLPPIDAQGNVLDPATGKPVVPNAPPAGPPGQ